MNAPGALLFGITPVLPEFFGNFWRNLRSYCLGRANALSLSVVPEGSHAASADPQQPVGLSADKQADWADIAEFKAGREVGFNRLVLRHKDKVHSQCFRLLGRKEDALDVAQEVFVRVYQGLPKFRGDAQFTTWLHTLTVNACRNRQSSAAWRERQQSETLEDGDERLAARPQGGDLEWNATPSASASATGSTPSSPANKEWSSGSPDEDLVRKRREFLLQRALNTLPTDFREAMVLRDVEGRSYEDIAAMTGWEIGTVRSRIFRAREKLRDLLEKGWE